MTNLYKILEINENANPDEIKKSYRRLVLKYHPDKNLNQNTTKIFQDIQMAYNILSDPIQKIKYDSLLKMNNNQILEIFMIYNQILNEIFDKYNIDAKYRQEIMRIFDSNDYQINMDNPNNLLMIHGQIYKKIIDHLSLILMNQVTTQMPYLSMVFSIIDNYFGD